MTYSVKPLPFKPSRLDGLSERLLASHYENNYGGAVRRLDAIEAELARRDPEVGQGVAEELRNRGRQARFLAGGLAAWRAEGGPVEPSGRVEP
jgi:hypothetical protein